MPQYVPDLLDERECVTLAVHLFAWTSLTAWLLNLARRHLTESIKNSPGEAFFRSFRAVLPAAQPRM